MSHFIKSFPQNRKTAFVIMIVMFALGSFLAVATAARSHNAIITEYDKHLYQLASTVDHNVYAVLNRCRTELCDLVSSEAFLKAEETFAEGKGDEELKDVLRKSAVLLSSYANLILVQNEDTIILSTDDKGGLDYDIIVKDDGDDLWLCVDNNTGKSYAALSCVSQVSGYTYYVLLDLELFFRRVVVDAIYGDHWIVLYNPKSGLALQNDNEQPEYRIFSSGEITDADDGYAKIYEREKTGEEGVSVYRYAAPSGAIQDVRIYVIPSEKSENGIVATAVAVYNKEIADPTREITLYNILAAVLIAFSVATAVFMFLHNGRKERELAEEIASLEKEKQLKEEILQQQEQVVHHQKLETIGTMTAGIAHEFNNLLSPIMGDSMLILEKTRTESPEIFENALEIYEASERAKKLVANISGLSRKQQDIKMFPVSPGKLLTDALTMGEVSIPGNITVKKEILTHQNILGDENQLSHMLLNLIINAVQAMTPMGGILTVSAYSDDDDVCIAVADTGEGIPEENLEAIFDPFFTTKEVGKGTGLGLPIAQRIAVDHGGTILAENLPQGGAKFTFRLPAIKKQA